MWVADVETDGLLDKLTRIHCLHAGHSETGETKRWGPDDIEDGIRWLMSLDAVAGHNFQGFDIPAIEKVYPWFKFEGVVWDTVIMSRLIYSNLRERDFAAHARGRLPEWFPKKGMVGRHSLEAWGYRLGDYKGDFKGPWDEWTQEMDDYCAQDIVVNIKLLHKLQAQSFGEESIRLEHDVQRLIDRQVKHGWAFDEERAVALVTKLMARKEELTKELQGIFPPFYLRAGEFIPKRPNKTQGYLAGCTLSKVKLTDFNPGSRDHVANRLTSRYGWKPRVFTPDGKPQLDEAVLKKMRFPEAPALLEYFMLTKRLGQVYDGKEAWLRKAKNGRIHGRVSTSGAVTGRMTHSGPNVTQVPANGKPYGVECRQCWTVPAGYKLVGFDADALELRCLAGRMARWDGGEYIQVVLNGRKEDGTDIHTRNMRALLIESRDAAKTWFYAWLYGAGDWKLGTVIAGALGKAKLSKKELIRLGRESRARFEANLPALGKLVKAVKKAAKRGYLRGLDGRRVYVRSDHSALNTLLQGDGAVLMKKALQLLDAKLQEMGWRSTAAAGGSHDYEFIGNIHDEVQAEVLPDKAEEYGETAQWALEEAGRLFEFACPITGQYAIGNDWSETH